MKTIGISMLLGALLALALPAQVSLKFTPEPMAVPTAQISNARQMGRWIIEGCNDGAAGISLPWERISMASPDIRFIDSDDALLVLTSNQSKTLAGTLIRIGTLAGQGLAIGLAVASKSNQGWATGLSVASSLAPSIVTIAQGQLPSVAPLTAGLKYPIALPPGVCFTDHRFAAKAKSVKVGTGTVVSK